MLDHALFEGLYRFVGDGVGCPLHLGSYEAGECIASNAERVECCILDSTCRAGVCSDKYSAPSSVFVVAVSVGERLVR